MNFFFDKENMMAVGKLTDSALIEHDDPSLRHVLKWSFMKKNSLAYTTNKR